MEQNVPELWDEVSLPGKWDEMSWEETSLARNVAGAKRPGADVSVFRKQVLVGYWYSTAELSDLHHKECELSAAIDK